MVYLADDQCRVARLSTRSGKPAFALAFHDYEPNVVALVTPIHPDFDRVARMHATIERSHVPPGMALSDGYPEHP